MITIPEGGRIYFLCPRNVASGGPESIHQVTGKMSQSGFDARMVYTTIAGPQTSTQPYEEYGVCVATEVIDDERNLLIVPEILTAYGRRYRRIRKAVFWLSVDNYFEHYREILRSKRAALRFLLRVDQPMTLRSMRKGFLHFAQGAYVGKFLASHKLAPRYPLGGFINREFLSASRKHSHRPKKNVVAYNPRKGAEFTSKLIAQAGHIEFRPLANMGREEMIDVLGEAKVYIDFGHHPGKERIPREAALLGCCVITSKRGSAAFNEDLAIPSDFKYLSDESQIEPIIERIERCFTAYDEEQSRFTDYIEIIRREESVLEANIRSAFALTSSAPPRVGNSR